MALKHFNILLTGEISNIGFTLQVMKAADELNIRGSAIYINKNKVKIEAEGKEADLMKFIDWCKTGVPEANISKIEINPNSVSDYIEFTITNQI